ncbi:hypothetical protein AMATHDRAFT_138330 [Amanita thiersii Skay4041]|uniref:Aerobactin siderophore biosynthesis IucA/IucC N-terminal domain-containing protein n=1 Tax=Amanita thiersii Skay4041 TaxID=703135 RepID=A0A2A9NXN7_9AGAR|nr:hypothetical protein AMATHDRAFT_138330 [Amanita thiersii Skay4041]
MDNPRRAAFGIISRLLSCLVTEQILGAFYLPFSDLDTELGIVVILSMPLMLEQPIVDRKLQRQDIFAIVLVHHAPVLDGFMRSKHGWPVRLLDPLDMLPEIYELAVSDSKGVQSEIETRVLDILATPSWDFDSLTMLVSSWDVEHYWLKFVEGAAFGDSIRKIIRDELTSCYEWQLSTYESPPPCPSIKSSRLEWEQSLVSGHPTHPMYRARRLPFDVLDYDWYHPVIRFVAVPRSTVDILGPFEQMINPLVEKFDRRSDSFLPDSDSFIIMPVHELQVENIKRSIPDVFILHDDINVQALAQASIRTVTIPELPGLAVKLAVGVKISSSLRTISHFTASFGPRFSEEIVPKLKYDSDLLKVEPEPASAIYRTTDPDIAKHLAVVLRAEYQPPCGEAVIICAGLLECDHRGSPPGVAAIQMILGLDTHEKREQFLRQYIRIACCALLPPLIYNGVAFEAHAQNVLVRMDDKTGEVKGFVVRDLGGLRIHPPTLRQTTGVDFEFLPDHCVATETIEETYPKFYHAFVHNHIQRLIRLLGFHYNGLGWTFLRESMREVIPVGHHLEKAWLDPSRTTILSKCLMRMRMRDSYRDMVYGPYPNMIQYVPQTLEERHLT